MCYFSEVTWNKEFMQIRIGNTSKLFISDNKISLVIRPSAISMTISSIVVFGCIFNLAVLLFASDHMKDRSLDVLFLTAIYPIYSYGYKEISEIEMKQRALVKKQFILGLCIYKDDISWREKDYFSYDIIYDSYENISSIWLAVRNNDHTGSRKLIKFIETNSFFEFKKIFNKKFPNHKIMEWHD